MRPNKLLRKSLTRLPFFALLVFIMGIASGQVPNYQAAYLYLGEYPADANPGWHEGVQGIAHDSANWYISQADVGEPEECRIWRIPAYWPLDMYPLTALIIGVEDVPDLYDPGYRHLGDIDYYFHEPDGTGFLAVPIHDHEDPRTLPTVVALFRVEPGAFVYLGKDVLHIDDVYAGSAWAAIDPEGKLCVNANTSDGVTAIFEYTVNWDDLATGGWPATTVTLSNSDTFRLMDENGYRLDVFQSQGGTFSEDGSLFYYVAGYAPDPHPFTDGISVFRTLNWQRVARSGNHSDWYFGYEFDFDHLEEPEGCTYWDLDDGSALGIIGHLHVLLLDYDWDSDDEIYLKHYTSRMYVDVNATGPFNGRPAEPFNSAAYAASVAWNHSRISFRGGTYPEVLSLGNKVQMEHWDYGPAVIGAGASMQH